MDDLAGKLSELLNSPEGMARIQNLASMLGQNQQESPAPADSSASSQDSGEGFSLGALSSLLGGMGKGAESAPALPDAGTLQLVTRLAPMLSAVRQEDDSTRLLRALRPLLGEARQKKVDEAIQILQMLRLLPLLKESGVFSGLLSGLL